MKPVIAHLKDRFLPASESFVFNQIAGSRYGRHIVLNRHQQQNRDIYPVDAHYSPAERFGSAFGLLERVLLRSIGYSPFLEDVIRRQDVDLIHAHFGQLGALFVPVVRRHRLPLVTSFYGIDVSVFAADPSWKTRFDRLWSEGDCFLVLGPTMGEQIERLGCPKDKIEILPIGIDITAFGYTARQPPEPGRPVRILTVGRLIPKKGTDVLLRAAAQLPAKYDYHLYVGGDGPLRLSLEKLTAELGLSDRVTFLGWLSRQEVSLQMQRAHLFVLPSRTDPASGEKEGTPTVILEAQATGLPVVATRHADIATIIDEGRADSLVPEDDVEALAAALAQHLAARNQWQMWGEAARTTAERHDRHAIQERLAQIYESLI